VSFPALEAPASTPFRCYARKKAKDASVNELAEDGVLVVGETDSVEFVSSEEESRRAANGGCRCVAFSLPLSSDTCPILTFK